MSTAQSMNVEAFMTLASVKMRKDFTEEQLEFAKDFVSPLISFSFPGTGKTTAAILGLLTAELHHKVQGKNIFALSFTKMATMELNQRHEEECKKLGIKSNPTFKTLSALCREILMKHYSKLGFNSIKISESFKVSEMADFLTDTAVDLEIPLDPYKVRLVIQAIRSLNSSLIFDRIHVESKMVFKKTGMSYEHFQMLRKAAYDLNKIMECVQLDDIFLYTLELLLRAPEVSALLKSEIKVLLIDEFQDMSLLQLRIVSLISDNVVAIGDIRQQIYAFNGACQEIVAKFKEYFPTAREVNLTQSFRCGWRIANYATSLILANKTGGEQFKGREDLEGEVFFHQQTSMRDMAEKIYLDYVDNHNVFSKDMMFIFRNNYSSIPIAEELYKKRVPFRVNKYKPAHQIPVIKDLCAIVELIRNPQSPAYLAALMMLFPEFDKYDSYMEIPHYKIMVKDGINFFDIKYQFKNQIQGNHVMEILRDARHMIIENQTLDKVFNKLWPIYETYLSKIEFKLEQPASYYTSLVSPLLQSKSYQQFTTDELRKADFIDECLERRHGIRCYTMHAAKGTEAPIIHIMDAVDGMLPNKSKIKDMLDKGCYVDAAREIRNERCLVYVAVSRAMEELHIHHNGPLASVFTSANEFENLDRLYESYSPDYNDVEVFEEFFKEAS